MRWIMRSSPSAEQHVSAHRYLRPMTNNQRVPLYSQTFTPPIMQTSCTINFLHFRTFSAIRIFCQPQCLDNISPSPLESNDIRDTWLCRDLMVSSYRPLLNYTRSSSSPLSPLLSPVSLFVFNTYFVPSLVYATILLTIPNFGSLYTLQYSSYKL